VAELWHEASNVWYNFNSVDLTFVEKHTISYHKFKDFGLYTYIRSGEERHLIILNRIYKKREKNVPNKDLPCFLWNSSPAFNH